jgi:hypothetical protein
MKVEVEIENGTIEIEDGVIVQISGEMHFTATHDRRPTALDKMADRANEVEVAALANSGDAVAEVGGVDWAEGIAHYRARWQAGLDGARDPGATRRWQAMLDTIDALGTFSLDTVERAMAELSAVFKKRLLAEKTPESIEACQAGLAALDTLRVKVPVEFPAKVPS